MTLCAGNPGLGLEQAQNVTGLNMTRCWESWFGTGTKCNEVKPVNGIPTLFL